jgi:phosphate butyryltransferase
MKISTFFVLYLIITNFTFSFTQDKEYSVFQHMYEYVKGLNKMKRIAVAGADNLDSLKAFRKLKDLGIADFILVGPVERIDKLAHENNIDISDFEIVDKKRDAEIATHAADLVKMRVADIYYKGGLNPITVLKAIFEDELFRKNKLVSGLSIMDIPKLGRPIILTDAHVKAYPTINQKIELINNAVEFAKSIGIKRPKVAIVAGIRNISREMRETEDASRLTKLNDMGQIKGCDVEGPLAFDVAVDPYSKLLNYLPTRKIRGDADIILFHNFHHANIAYNLLLHIVKARSATLLGGTRYPVVFASRSGSADYKFDSIITSIFFSEYTKNNPEITNKRKYYL